MYYIHKFKIIFWEYLWFLWFQFVSTRKCNNFQIVRPGNVIFRANFVKLSINHVILTFNATLVGHLTSSLYKKPKLLYKFQLLQKLLQQKLQFVSENRFQEIKIVIANLHYSSCFLFLSIINHNYNAIFNRFITRNVEELHCLLNFLRW